MKIEMLDVETEENQELFSDWFSVRLAFGISSNFASATFLYSTCAFGDAEGSGCGDVD